jgi:hypothetical protein
MDHDREHRSGTGQPPARAFSGLEPLLPQIESVICAALAALLFWKGILPAWRVLNTDFPNYYLVARLLREGFSLDRIYDWIWLQRIKDHWGLEQSLVGFAGLTPSSALPIVPLTFWSALNAKRIWVIVNILFLAGSAEILHRSTSLSRRRVWILSLLAIVPLQTSFLYGQMHMCVLLCLVLAWYLHEHDRDIECGVLIAIAGSLKIYPLLLGALFLWKRQWKPLLGLLAGLGAILLITSAFMGETLLETYFTQILPASTRGEALDPYAWQAASGAALFHRLFLFEPALNPTPLIDSPNLYSILYPLWQAAVIAPLLILISPGSGGRDRLEYAGFVLSLLVLSPVPSSYHFVVMILPMTFFVDRLLQNRDCRRLSFGIVLYLLISTSDLWSRHLGESFPTTIGFARLWLAILLYALLLTYLWKVSESRPHYGAICVVGVVAVCAIVVSVAGYRRHFDHRSEQMSRRLPDTSNSYLQTNSRSGGGGYKAVAMMPEGYGVIDQFGNASMNSKLPVAALDQLSFDIGPGGEEFIEVADAAGSRIVASSDGQVLEEDAESPAISPDGEKIAFLRERKGRGSLWIQEIDPRSLQAQGEGRLLTDGEYDVRNVRFLRSGDLMFAAKHGQKVGLFTLTPGSSPRALSLQGGDVGSFDIAPDNTIAFTQRTPDGWQLFVTTPIPGELKSLSAGSCNAYSPSWVSSTTVLYATDCGRGTGLSALALATIQ